MDGVFGGEGTEHREPLFLRVNQTRKLSASRNLDRRNCPSRPRQSYQILSETVSHGSGSACIELLSRCRGPKRVRSGSTDRTNTDVHGMWRSTRTQQGLPLSRAKRRWDWRAARDTVLVMIVAVAPCGVRDSRDMGRLLAANALLPRRLRTFSARYCREAC